jgi:hypothetical protein
VVPGAVMEAFSLGLLVARQVLPSDQGLLAIYLDHT